MSNPESPPSSSAPTSPPLTLSQFADQYIDNIAEWMEVIPVQNLARAFRWADKAETEFRAKFLSIVDTEDGPTRRTFEDDAAEVHLKILKWALSAEILTLVRQARGLPGIAKEPEETARP